MWCREIERPMGALKGRKEAMAVVLCVDDDAVVILRRSRHLFALLV